MNSSEDNLINKPKKTNELTKKNVSKDSFAFLNTSNDGEKVGGKAINQRRIEYKNGDVYNGEIDVVTGKPNGKGTFHYKNGRTYTGEVKDGIRHGIGRFTFNSKTVIEGEFENGKYCSKGRIEFNNGNVYNGEMDVVTGKPNGIGTLNYEDGKTYTGEFKDGKKHGFGRETFKKGSFYEGDFENGEFHGKGKFSHVNGISYEGTYKQGIVDVSMPTKKNQTVLAINKDKIIGLESFKKRYENVVPFTATSTMNAELLEEVITKSTKGENKYKKLKIIINEHGTEEGNFRNQKFILETLKGTLDELIKHNNNNIKNTVENIDIIMSSCYGSKIVYENKEFHEVLKNFIDENIDLYISAGDEKFASSIAIGNNKNSMPISKTGENYIINEFRLSKQTDFNNLVPYRVKEFENEEKFLNDYYKGKENRLPDVNKRKRTSLKDLKKRAKATSKEKKNTVRYKEIDVMDTLDYMLALTEPVNADNKLKKRGFLGRRQKSKLKSDNKKIRGMKK